MVLLCTRSVDGDMAAYGGEGLGRNFVGVGICVVVCVGEVLMEDCVWLTVEAADFGGFFVAVGADVNVVVVTVSAGCFALFAVGLDASFEAFLRIGCAVGDYTAAP